MLMLPKKMPEQDLLHEWLKRVRFQNSEFNLQRKIKIADESLVQLRDFFIDFFGADYFKIEARQLTAITLKAKNSYWFLQLLANDDFASLAQLFEIAHVLKHTAVFHPALYKILQVNTKDQAFRNYYFEAVIYEMLMRNSQKIETKPIINGKEKEGFVYLQHQKVLFECKKLYSYQLPSISFIFSVHEEFFRLWQSKPVSINGFITIKRCNEEQLRKARSLFNRAFKEYIAQPGDLHFNRDILDKHGKLIGNILFEPYDVVIFNHQVELIHDTAACFRVMPPKSTVIEEELKHIHNTKLQLKFAISEKESVDHFLEKLTKKRASQSDMKEFPRIFFFDNEIYRGTEFGLFQSEDTFDGTAIQAYVNSKETDDIVCIVFRTYFLDYAPQWSIKVFCKPELEEYKSLIKSWSSLYKDEEFLSTLPVFL